MSKFKAHGTTVSIGGTDIGGIINLTTPDESRGVAETTDSGSGGDRTFIDGLRDAGEMTIDVRWDPDDTGQGALDTNYEASGSSATEEVIITLPSAATSASGSQTLTFDAIVTGRSSDLDAIADETADRSYTLKVTGSVTIA